MVAVGGDYKTPDNTAGTAASTVDIGARRAWLASHSMPHGYRSAVAYHEASKTWIAVGTNGTDISRDDGRRWQALRPTHGEAADADRNWNALSLPFVVGPNGGIGKLVVGDLRR